MTKKGLYSMNKKFTIKNSTIVIENGKITIDFDEKDVIETIKENKETPDDCTSDNGNNKVKLSELNPGDEFYIGSSVYVVVDHIDGTTKVISKEISHKMAFDYDCLNDYRMSGIRELLNTYDYNYIAYDIDKHNIVPTKCDTTAMDGSGSYEITEDAITILSVKEYCEYYDILNAIPNFTSESQWLSNPVSMINKAKSLVCTVDKDGLIEYMPSDNQNIGVRLFFTLKSSTEVKPCKPMKYDDNNAETTVYSAGCVCY